MTEPAIPHGFDFTDPDLYAQRVPLEEFARLRRTAPVWWNPQRRGIAGFDDEGYWVVSRHADVLTASRRSDLFSSWENTAVARFKEDMTREQIEMQRLVMLNIDPPQHTKVRAIVQRGFTPGPSTASATRSPSGPSGSYTRRRSPVPVTSSTTSPASCPCRRSPSCSAYRRRTGA